MTRHIYIGALLTALVFSIGPAQAQRPASTVQVYKSPTCGCCANWVKHLQQHGFRTQVTETDDVAAIKAQHRIPARAQSCHTAVVEGYVIEGHVPADLIQRLLRERPAVVGLAVPGMPVGAPGMEAPGRPAERYDVLTFDRSGRTTVFARR